MMREKKQVKWSPLSTSLDQIENIDYLVDFGLPTKNEVMRDYLTTSFETYKGLPFPGRKDEAWRRTSLSELDLSRFSLVGPKFEESESSEPLTPLDTSIAGQISLHTTSVVTDISELASHSGVVFCDLSTAIQTYPELISKKLGEVVPASDGKFSALASAFALSGVVLYVPKKVKIDQPFLIQISQSQAWRADFFHLLIWLEEGASAEVSIELLSEGKIKQAQTLSGGIVEIVLDDHAKLNLTEMQCLSADAWLFTHERAKIGTGAQLDWVYVGLGGRLAKSFIDVDLIGEDANAKVGGLYIGKGKQQIDFDTQQNHLAANTISDLIFKGAMRDESRSVWQGMIYVAKDAKSSDGYQKNDNLMLSKKARASAIPGLEILNNDVRCSHGATVSKLSKEELFYLQTRGIDAAEGEKLLLKGFFVQVSGMIINQRIREMVDNLIDAGID